MHRRKVLEGWNTMQEISRTIWRFSRSVQTSFVLQIPATSAYQGAYSGFLLVLLMAVALRFGAVHVRQLEIPASFRSGFFRISRLFPRWFDDIDISKNINPAQFQQPSTFSLLPTSAQDGTLCHGRDPLHSNRALRSLKAEH